VWRAPSRGAYIPVYVRPKVVIIGRPMLATAVLDLS
jgi:hypothetical protein